MSSPFTPGFLVGGRYRIERLIGHGGMARVHLARDEVHQRYVAVKVLGDDVGFALAPERFEAEIRTTARLSHPHILPLLDSGVEGGALYYVTPFVRGETLRDRIRREGPLPLATCIRFAAELADALAYAHAEGVVHRDVKPSNILIDRSTNVYLADFGIARALASPDDGLRTASGFVLGTPSYLSPEQIEADQPVEGAADVYALAAVTFEMLAGRPPFEASTTQALLAAHLVKSPPSLRASRADVPDGLDALVRAGLAKDAIARTSAEEFARRLAESRTEMETRTGDAIPAAGREASLRSSGRLRRPLLLAGVVGLTAVALVVAASWSARPWAEAGASAPDSTRYMVLPFDQPEIPGLAPFDVSLEGALSSWEGIHVVDGLQVRDALARTSTGTPVPLARIPLLAESLDVGRILTGRAVVVGDSVRIEASLLSAGRASRPLRSESVTVSTSSGLMEGEMHRLTERLLFGTETPGSDASTASGTRSAAARREFDLGRAALVEWSLLDAESRFSEAAAIDPYYDAALLWKAQVMNWRGRPSTEWGADARRAARGAETMPVRERLLATALGQMADGEYPSACATYDRLRERDAGDFAAWFGLGDCRRRDTQVVSDSTSPTGWSFRGSGHASALAYQRAFSGLPSSYRAFGPGSSDLLGLLLNTVTDAVRSGRGAPPDSRPYIGFRQWLGDSLAVVAVPIDSLAFAQVDPAADSAAVQHQRRALLDLATEWSRAFSTSADARYSLAAVRDLVGDPSGLRTYREARGLTDDPRVFASIAAAEAILRVRLSMPDDVAGILWAVALADSILVSEADPYNSEALARLAVLVRRPMRAAAYLRQAARGLGAGQLPVEASGETDALLAYAAAAGPIDSIRALELRAGRRILQTVPAEDVRATQQLVLEQAALLAYPLVQMEFLADASLPRSREGRAIVALERGEVDVALEMLGPTPPRAGWDIVLVRSSILTAAGRPDLALELLGGRLDGLATGDGMDVSGVARIGGLARAAALRAALERQVGSPAEEARWSRAVEALWSSSEPLADPTAAVLAAAARSPGG